MARMRVNDIVPWPYTDKWAGHEITEEAARKQADYALEMHEAARRGQLQQFIDTNKRKPP